jgi:AraC family transcriptional regulator, activator of mtrCDE
MKPLSDADLDRLLVELEVDSVTLSECAVSPEWTLAFPRRVLSAIHYNISGTGQLLVENFPPINLTPHTLVIIPARTSCEIAAPPFRCAPNSRNTEHFTGGLGKIFAQSAGSGEAAVRVMCGYMQATYGNSIDVFGSLTMPIVERFNESNGLDEKLKMARAELIKEEIGMRAMISVLLKIVVLAILRRSTKSAELWEARLPILADPQIARALASMLADLTAEHTVRSLSSTAGLSRSAFMNHFSKMVGISPIAALKQLRMRKAAGLLAVNVLQIDQIANIVGYESRSSFSRAFRSIYGTDPSDYRTDNRFRAIKEGSMNTESGDRATSIDSLARSKINIDLAKSAIATGSMKA